INSSRQPAPDAGIHAIALNLRLWIAGSAGNDELRVHSGRDATARTDRYVCRSRPRYAGSGARPVALVEVAAGGVDALAVGDGPVAQRLDRHQKVAAEGGQLI